MAAEVGSRVGGTKIPHGDLVFKSCFFAMSLALSRLNLELMLARKLRTCIPTSMMAAVSFWKSVEGSMQPAAVSHGKTVNGVVDCRLGGRQGLMK